MLKKYKNGFIDIIRDQGLDPADFITAEISDARPTPGTPEFKELHFTLRFKNTPLGFEVRHTSQNLHVFAIRATRFNMHFTTVDEVTEQPFGASSKPMLPDIHWVYTQFTAWLTNHVKLYIEEMTLPDLWQQIEQQKQLVSADPLTDYETSPFTEPEKQEVRASIGQFRVLILESFSPTQEQLEVIDQKLDYLMAAVDRPINRFDWKSIAVSTVIGIVTALSLDTERGRQLFELFKQAFSGVLHLLPGS